MAPRASTRSPSPTRSSETQFIPQEDDAELLWEVLEITAEKSNQYRVKWAGTDPQTMKPWPQSWVPKHDCTDDLVLAWKAKKEQKADRKGPRASRGRMSTATSKSRASTSTTKSTRSDAKRTPTSSTTSVIPKVEVASPGSAKTLRRLSKKRTKSPVSPTPGTKRKRETISGHSSLHRFEEDAEPVYEEEEDEDPEGEDGKTGEKPKSRSKPPSTRGTVPPKKRRRIASRESLTRPPARPDELDDEGFASQPMRGQAVATSQSPGSTAQPGVPSPVREDDEDEEQEVQVALSDFDEPNLEEEVDELQDDDDVPLPQKADSDSDSDLVPTRRKHSLPERKSKPQSTAQPRSKQTISQPAPPTAAEAEGEVQIVAEELPFKVGPPKRRKKKKISASAPPPASNDVVARAPDAAERLIPEAYAITEEATENGDGTPPPPLDYNQSTSPQQSAKASTSAAPEQALHAAITAATSRVSPQPAGEQEFHPVLSPGALSRLEEFDRDMLVLEWKEEKARAAKSGGKKAKRSLGEKEAEKKRLERLAILLREEEEEESQMIDQPPVAPPVPAKPVVSDVPPQINSSYSGEVIPETQSSHSSTQRHILPKDLPRFATPEPTVPRVEPQTPLSRNGSIKARMRPRTPSSVSICKTPSSNRREGAGHLPPLAEDDEPDADIRRSRKGKEPLRTPSPRSTGATNGSILVTAHQAAESRKPLRPLPLISPSAFHPHLALDPPSPKSSPGKDDSIEDPSSFEQSQKKRVNRHNGSGKRAFTVDEDDEEAPMSSIEDFDSPDKSRAQTRREVVQLVKKANSKKRRTQSLTGEGEHEVIEEVRKQEPSESDDDRLSRKISERGMELAEKAKLAQGGSGRTERKALSDIVPAARREPSPVQQEEEAPAETEEPPEMLVDEPSQVPESDMVLPVIKTESDDGDLDLERNGESVPDFGVVVEAPEDDDRFSVDPPDITIQEPSRAPSMVSESDEEEQRSILPPVRRNRSRSRSKTPTAVSLPKVDPMSRLVLPSASSSKPASKSSVPSSALSLLAAKSEEVSRLDRQLTAEQEKNAALQEQISGLQARLAVVQPEAREEWNSECEALTLKLQAAEDGKKRALADVELFKDQYRNASGFVISTREENRELEKRTAIAEQQAKDGVALIRATFEARVKSLEEDLRSWRRMAEFVVEKDRRTNDEIRMRAASEPEWRAKLKRAKDELAKCHDLEEDRLVQLEEAQKQLEDAEEDVQRYKSEAHRLALELAEANTTLERLGRNGQAEDSSGDGHQFVYRCSWQVGAPGEFCRQHFGKLSELQTHVSEEHFGL